MRSCVGGGVYILNVQLGQLRLQTENAPVGIVVLPRATEWKLPEDGEQRSKRLIGQCRVWCFGVAVHPLRTRERLYSLLLLSDDTSSVLLSCQVGEEECRVNYSLLRIPLQASKHSESIYQLFCHSRL